jgi:hypothetical protein
MDLPVTDVTQNLVPLHVKQKMDIFTVIKSASMIIEKELNRYVSPSLSPPHVPNVRATLLVLHWILRGISFLNFTHILGFGKRQTGL